MGALLIWRFGDWLYPGWQPRALLMSFFAAVGVSAALFLGALLYALLSVLPRVRRAAGRAGVALVLAGIGAFGLQAFLRRPAMEVYAQVLVPGLLCIGLLLVATLAHRRAHWVRLELCIVVAVTTLLSGAAALLNLVYVRSSAGSAVGPLNALLWGGAYVLTALGIRASGRLPFAARERRSPGSRVALAVVVLGALAVLVPLHREALRISEPPVAAAAAGEPTPETTAAPQPPAARNVILVSVDTLRADHMGLYGHPRNTTPHIDRFFADGIVFERMYAQAPWTLPSHVSMLTGQFPSTHGVRFAPAQLRGTIDRLPESAVTLAEILRQAGFGTAAFTGGTFLTSRYGFDQGFETFVATESARMREALEKALPWLQRHGSAPFFLFIHSYDVHKYEPPRVWGDLPDGGYRGFLRAVPNVGALAGPNDFYDLSPADVDYLRHLYENELRSTDAQLASLFEALRELGLVEQTAVLLTADHGEEFWEHGRTGHSFALTETLLRVPLLVSAPGLRTGRRVDQPAQTIDIAPTVLDLCGVDAPGRSEMQGVSLLPLLRGEGRPRSLVLSEADALDSQAALVDGRYKYVHRGVPAHNPLDAHFLMLTARALFAGGAREELYDLAEDPGERQNLAGERPSLAAEHRGRLFERLRQLRAGKQDSGERSAPLTPELEAGLRALGYLE